METVLNILSMVVQIVNQIPVLGPYLVLMVKIVGIVSGVISALVALLHAVVIALQGLAKVPGLEKVAVIADKLSHNEEAASGILNKYVFPILAQLSVIPLPKPKQ